MRGTSRRHHETASGSAAAWIATPEVDQHMPRTVIRERALEAIGRFIIRYSLVFLAIGAGWFVTAVSLCQGFKLYDEPGNWAPPSHPLVQRTKEIERRFGGSNHVVVMVTRRDGDIFNRVTL